MEPLRIRTAPEQLAEYLKKGIRAGRWTDRMPGEDWMMTHLQVGRDTVRVAWTLLEKEGVLVSEGQGKRRRIVMGADALPLRALRVRILSFEKQDRGEVDISSLLAGLLEAGFHAEFSEKSLKELGMQVGRVARYVKQNPADAWIVCAASREVLEWFAEQPVPALALYGSHQGLPLASAFVVMVSGQIEAVQRLIDLGHKRIVMVTREERRKPQLSRPEQLFIQHLESAGITTGDYNLPDWEESREGLESLLNELFRFSPPTALYFQEVQLYIAARLYLSDRGIVPPRDVSLVVADPYPGFSWNNPVPSHIQWDYRPVVRRVVRWARNLEEGKEDGRKFGTEAKFVEGGTIGPVPGLVGRD
jgi:DNA-binding transcriptional regulator YhcF (GntR family)